MASSMNFLWGVPLVCTARATARMRPYHIRVAQALQTFHAYMVGAHPCGRPHPSSVSVEGKYIMDTRAILQAIDHRTTPLSTGPWVMTQIWHELLFAHWPIEPNVLRPLIPSALPLDTFDGQCWVGIVPFHMSNVHPRGLPSVYGLSQFPELNVRTYVMLHDRPGVYFFSLDAANPVAVAIARALFHLPYFTARMSSRRIDDTIYYRSHRIHRNAPSADYHASYRPIAPVAYARP